VLKVKACKRVAAEIPHVLYVYLQHPVTPTATALLLGILEHGEVTHNKENERHDPEGQEVNP